LGKTKATKSWGEKGTVKRIESGTLVKDKGRRRKKDHWRKTREEKKPKKKLFVKGQRTQKREVKEISKRT